MIDDLPRLVFTDLNLFNVMRAILMFYLWIVKDDLPRLVFTDHNLFNVMRAILMFYL